MDIKPGYIQVEEIRELDGTLIRIQQCLYCSKEFPLERYNKRGEIVRWPAAEHVLLEHL